jgi:DNA-directed RNA polymerase specialized sigma24 family protein
VAFVLCYLEGKTNEEAARLLGCPRGTILSRLARARERLRRSLSRRGLALGPAPFARHRSLG